MDLLVDIGNTRIRWCRAEGGITSETVAREYAKAALGELLHEAWAAMPVPDRVVIANVGGPVAQAAVSDAAAGLWGLSPLFVTARPRAAGVINSYAKPARLGADRWAAMIAARRVVGGAVCVIDCGTATTFDVLDATGRHQGGLILPGLSLLRLSLINGTSDLQPAGETRGRRNARKAALLACETADAIEAGTMYMLIAAIDRICHDVSADLGIKLTRIITGGDAPALLPLLAGDYLHEPDLVLKGLVLIAGDMT